MEVSSQHIPRIHDLRGIVSRVRELILDDMITRERPQRLSELLVELDRIEAGLDRYLGLFERAVQGIFIVTTDGSPVDCNHAFSSMLGYSSPEELLASVVDFGSTHFTDPGERVKNVSLLKEHGELINREVILKHRDLSPVWTLANMTLTESGLIEGISIDITPQKLAEQKLIESEERHRRILETAGEGFYLTDKDLFIVSVNEALCKMTGFGRDEFLGKRILGFAGAKLRDYLLLNRESLLTMEHRTFQGDLVAKDSRHIPVLFNANTLRDRDGVAIGNAVFVTDLTEQKKALQLAAEVQRGLLPRQSPQMHGLEMAGASISCEEIGGDYFDYLEHRGVPSGSISIVVGDVTGHGVAAALLMTSARAFLRSCAWGEKGLSDHLNDMNRYLIEDMASTGHFMTLFCIALEPARRMVRWVRAGHDPAILYLPGEDNFEELKGLGMALGIEEKYEYQEHVRQNVPRGAVIAIGTDGIWEARNIPGEMYGKERFRNVIRENGAASAEEILRSVFSDLTRFTIGVGLRDDATLVVVKFI